MEDSQRLIDAINALDIAARGTLWFVKDTIWEQIILNFIRKRRAHPGLAIGRKKKFRSLLDTVPMMIGTSRNNKGLRIDDVMPLSPSKRRHTYFSVIRPLMPIGKEDPLAVKNFIGNDELIQRNYEKPRLNADEMSRLDAYLFARGIR